MKEQEVDVMKKSVVISQWFDALTSTVRPFAARLSARSGFASSSRSSRFLALDFNVQHHLQVHEIIESCKMQWSAFDPCVNMEEKL